MDSARRRYRLIARRQKLAANSINHDWLKIQISVPMNRPLPTIWRAGANLELVDCDFCHPISTLARQHEEDEVVGPDQRGF
jgi:hypothetical protein